MSCSSHEPKYLSTHKLWRFLLVFYRFSCKWTTDHPPHNQHSFQFSGNLYTFNSFSNILHQLHATWQILHARSFRLLIVVDFWVSPQDTVLKKWNYTISGMFLILICPIGLSTIDSNMVPAIHVWLGNTETTLQRHQNCDSKRQH